MGFSVAKGSLLCVVALAALQTCSAFVPSKRAFATTKQLVGAMSGSIAPARTNLALSMVVEQFIANRDEKTRNEDNTKYLAEIQKRVDRINALEPEIEDLGGRRCPPARVLTSGNYYHRIYHLGHATRRHCRRHQGQ